MRKYTFPASSRLLRIASLPCVSMDMSDWWVAIRMKEVNNYLYVLKTATIARRAFSVCPSCLRKRNIYTSAGVCLSCMNKLSKEKTK